MTVASAAGKRVLVVVYSQTGQSRAVAEAVAAPLREAGAQVHVETLRPQPEYPYPWPFFRFLDAFPESQLMQPPALAPLALTGDEDFDLVILSWQVWYLAPSPPFVAFLRHPVARQLLRGKPVVTLISCRNMWMLANEKMKALLAECGARLLDNAVLVDPGPTLATFITTPRWLWTGRQEGFWGLPRAGLSPEQIGGTRRFGVALAQALAEGREKESEPLLAGLGAAHADPRLLASEKAGTRSFQVWGRLLRAAGPPGAPQRVPLLALYAVFLVAIIVTVVPLSLVVQALARPLLKDRLNRIRQGFEQPSGSGTERLTRHDD